jgi:RNA polymerase sigma-70 factor, ECF subfamily
MTVQDRDFRRALGAAQSGDLAAFDELWRLVGPRLDRYLAITAPDRAEAVAAATWTTVAAGLPAFRGGAAAFRNVLVRVARDEIAQRWRPDRRGTVATLPTHETPGPSVPLAPPGRRIASGARAGAAMLSGLARDVAEMVALRVVGGLATQETAGLLGTRAGFVIVAVHRGLRRAAAAAYPHSTGVAWPDPWQLDRLIDRVALIDAGAPPELAVLNPALRRLLAALTADGPPGDPAQLSTARLVFARCVGPRPGAAVSGLDVVTGAGGPFVRPQPMG